MVAMTRWEKKQILLSPKFHEKGKNMAAANVRQSQVRRQAM